MEQCISFVEDAEYHTDLLPMLMHLNMTTLTSILKQSLRNLNASELRQLVLDIRCINDALPDNILQYILGFCNPSSRNNVCTKWNELIRLNVKKLQKMAMNIGYLWDIPVEQQEATAIIVPKRAADQKQRMNQLLAKKQYHQHVYGPFESIEKAWSWWDAQYVEALHNGHLVRSHNLVPEFNTFVLANGFHDEQHCGDYETGSPFNLRPGKIIGIGDYVVMYDNCLEDASLSGLFVEYGEDIFFENVIFDGRDECYDKYGKYGYITIDAGATAIFKNCIFRYNCGPVPIWIKKNDADDHNQEDINVQIIGCVFENDDNKYLNNNQHHQIKCPSVHIHCSEYCIYPALIQRNYY